MTLLIFSYGLMALAALPLVALANHLIDRLPVMLDQESDSAKAHDTSTGVFSPAPHCPHCQQPLAWYDQIPVWSYVRLKAQCRHCLSPIEARYFWTELCALALVAMVAIQQDHFLHAVVWALFGIALLVLTVIDARTCWLPDAITLPLVWAGLLASSVGITGIPLSNALYGAVGGYVFLWIINRAFVMLRGHDGMGYGDFKLLAALGAWFGWQSLFSTVLLASMSGLLLAVPGLILGRMTKQTAVPFGPFLIAGAMLTRCLPADWLGL